MILFCIPYAGGGREAYNGWQQGIGDAGRIRVADLPGRGARFGDPLVEDMPTLVAELSRQCEDIVDGPFAVFGYSFGAIVAYALTRHLQERGITPRRLFVGAAPAPHRPLSAPLLHRLSDEELVTELAAFAGTQYQVLSDPELMSIFLPIIRADSRVMETYRPPEVRVDCPISAFGGNRDHRVALADLLAWAELGAGGSDVRVYQGGHFVLHSHRARLCRAVSAALRLGAPRLGDVATPPGQPAQRADPEPTDLHLRAGQR